MVLAGDQPRRRGVRGILLEPVLARLAAVADERCQPDTEPDQQQSAEEIKTVALEVIDEKLRGLAQAVADVGEDNRPNNGADEIEREKPQPRDVRRADHKRRDVTQNE